MSGQFAKVDPGEGFHSSAVQEGLRLVAELEASPGPWGAPELEAIHRLLRDAEGPVWERAARAVGNRAASESGALHELQALLCSGTGEIRLRGVWALATLAHERQVEVAEFLVQRLGEPESLQDAALLAGLLRVAAALPPELGEGVLVFCLGDPREDIRAAAAASLPEWEPWPRLLLFCADDPSPVVRAALGVGLRYLPASDEVNEVLEALALDPDPLVRYAVVEALEEEEAPVPLPRPTLAENLVDRARALERDLLEDRESWRAVLDRCELWPDGVEVLGTGAEVGRDPGVRAVMRALGWLLVEQEDSLAGACGALYGCDGHGCEALADFLAACESACEVRVPEDLAHWARSLDLGLAARLSPHAHTGLEELRRIGATLHYPTARPAASRVEELENEAFSWPLPERVAVQTVTRAWLAVLEPGRFPEEVRP